MDIVDRLKDQDKQKIIYADHVSYWEAATVIEDLQLALDIAKQDARYYRDETERLRNELQRIADVSERWADSLVSQINEMAHKALKDKQ